MAVGIEDASMLYGLRTRRIPPIANHKEQDPELGNLTLSKGGHYPNIEYGLRFAAGFGSQIALSLLRRWPVEGDRIDGSRLLAWARSLAGTDDVVFRILQNKLVSYVKGEDNLHGGVQGDSWEPTAAWEGRPSEAPKPTPESVPDPIPSPQVSSSVPPIQPASQVEDAGMTATVIQVVVDHTGYPADFVELDQDLEGELGIDTVKQAEIMADIREKFSLPLDEDFVLADYPTLSHMIGYIQRMTGGRDAPSPAPTAAVQPMTASQESAPDPSPMASAAVSVRGVPVIATTARKARFASIKDGYVLKSRQGNLRLSNTYNQQFLMTKQLLTLGKQRLVIHYDDYQQISGQWIPMQVRYEGQAKGETVQLEFAFRKVEINSEIRTPFSIPKSYTRL